MITRARLAAIGRRNWPFAAVFTAGLTLRVLAEVAYRPAIFYIDTMKYLYSSYPGSDPVGYEVPLKAILAVGNLETVTAVQHLLGLAIAVASYLVLVRLGSWRWLAAIAVAPVLLDGYQIQIEQTIMPDVWFEALITAGLIALVALPAGRARALSGLRAVLVAGLVFGLSATVRQIGEVLILPGLLYVLLRGGGWRTVLTRSAGFTAAFAIPVVGYMTVSGLLTGHYWLASATPSLSTYGRMASAADCATLRIPSYERPLCPSRQQLSYGIDWLDHDAASPLKSYAAPAGMNRFAVIASFDRQVAEEQPVRVGVAVARDAATLFALRRRASRDGTPIARWQFQPGFPTYPGWVRVSRSGTIVVAVHPSAAGTTTISRPVAPSYGSTAHVVAALAAFLRTYQLDGGYTPGPLMALFALAGLAGSVLVLTLRAPATAREPALGCLMFFSSGVIVLLASDIFQFSWRYQLPALVTLPTAGVLGLTALVRVRARDRRTDPGSTSAQRTGRSQELTPG